MIRNWPVWRTDPGAEPIPRSIPVAAALITWLGPPLLGGIVTGIGTLVGHIDNTLFIWSMMAARVAIIGSGVTWIFIFAAVPLSRLALRKGYGGWALALLCGAVMSAGGMGLVSMADGLFRSHILFIAFLCSGMAHAGLFWVATRALSPESFRAR